MKHLADELLAYDAAHPPETPGDTEQEVLVPGKLWARWTKLAQVAQPRNGAERRAHLDDMMEMLGLVADLGKRLERAKARLRRARAG